MGKWILGYDTEGIRSIWSSLQQYDYYFVVLFTYLFHLFDRYWWVWSTCSSVTDTLFRSLFWNCFNYLIVTLFFFVISSLLPDVICFITTKYFLVVLLITNISNSRYMVRLFYLNIFGISDPCYLFQYSYIFSPCILIMNIFRIYLDHGLF